jgi:hypothetical protein
MVRGRSLDRNQDEMLDSGGARCVDQVDVAAVIDGVRTRGAGSGETVNRRHDRLGAGDGTGDRARIAHITDNDFDCVSDQITRPRGVA